MDTKDLCSWCHDEEGQIAFIIESKKTDTQVNLGPECFYRVFVKLAGEPKHVIVIPKIKSKNMGPVN